jgi:hypothetical protein
MDPHKRSVTIEVMTSDEAIAGGGRFATDPDGYRALLAYAKLSRSGFSGGSELTRRR